MPNTRTLLKFDNQWITNNFIDVTVESGRSYRELVERVASGAYTPIPIEFLSPTLGQKTLTRGCVVSGRPRDFFDSLSSTSRYVWRCSPYLCWWITGSGLRLAENPPEGVSYVDANGVLMSKKHRPIRVRSQGEPPRYRSALKRAILDELVKEPNASAREICCRIDAKDSPAVAPAKWRVNKEDRCLLSIYEAGGDRRAKLESVVSKVRSDLKDVSQRRPSPPIIF